MNEAQPAAVRQLVTVRRICTLMNISRTTLWRLSQAVDFPARYMLSSRSVRYDLTEIQRWLSKRKK